MTDEPTVVALATTVIAALPLAPTTNVSIDAPAVGLPGEAALERRARALAEGLRLAPAIREALAPWSERLAVTWPATLPA